MSIAIFIETEFRSQVVAERSRGESEFRINFVRLVDESRFKTSTKSEYLVVFSKRRKREQ
ncbi:hypothetical protein IQ277_12260 [Nostocales cyanobacterium LEGE 12452]|nr:hypothetical protein [Nostocales cyanobacterium LEGE 12452]